MAVKKFVSLENLTEYDGLIKGEIKTGDDATLESANSYTDSKVSNITSGTIVVKEAEHADSADEAGHAGSADHAESADSATKATQDGDGKVITSTYETKTDASAKLTEAKTYTDSSVDELAANVAYIDSEDNENITGDDIDGNIVIDSALSTVSTNPVQNKVVTNKINELQDAKVVIQNTQPTNGALWIDTDSEDEVILAEIDDYSVSEESTWSSKKISNELENYLNELNGVPNDVQNLTNRMGSLEHDIENLSNNFGGLEHDIENLSEDKVDKYYGASNAGKILMVDANGNLTLTDLPELGMSGDIVGVVSENNEIVLTGVLPEGSYTINYEMEDGTMMQIGQLNLESEQVVPVVFHVGKIDYNNGGAIVSSSTYLYTDMIEKEPNKAYTYSVVGDGAYLSVRVCYYDADGNYIGISGQLVNHSATYESSPITGAWSTPLMSEAKTFRFRIGHEDAQHLAATQKNFVLTKHTITYTNLLPISTDENGNVLNGCGYKDNTSHGSYGGVMSKDTAKTGHFTTGYIPYTNAQAKARVPFYVKGIDIDLSNLSSQLIRFSFCIPGSADWFGVQDMTDISDIKNFYISKLGEKYYMLQPNSNTWSVNAWQNFTNPSVRWTLPGSGSGVIITIDEPIE